MKLTTTMDHPAYFLRRMVGWCCGQLRMPVRLVRQAHFGKRAQSWRGTAWGHRIRVMIGATTYPTRSVYCRQQGAVQYDCNDPVELLILITAHELAHVRNFNRRGVPGHRYAGAEQSIDAHAYHVLKAFREQREQLVARWSAVPARVAKSAERKSVSRRERNARAALDKLTRWERRLKAARTRVSKLRRAVRRYERAGVLAATSADQ